MIYKARIRAGFIFESCLKVILHLVPIKGFEGDSEFTLHQLYYFILII